MTRSSKDEVQNQYETQINLICDSTIREYVKTQWLEAMAQTKKGHITAVDSRKRARLFAFGESIKDLWIESIQWNPLCEIVNNTPLAAPGICDFIYFLLKNDLYSGDHREKLNELKEFFSAFNITNSSIHKIFIFDEVEKIYYYQPDLLLLGRNYNGPRFIFINSDTKSIRELLFIFFAQDNLGISFCSDFYTLFNQSLGDNICEVFKPSDFNCITYQTQLNFFLEANLKKTKTVILSLNRFYVYLSDILGVEIFKKTDALELIFLKRQDYAQRMIDGFEPIYFNPYTPTPTSDKWILHVNNNDQNSTTSSPITTRVYDFTSIHSQFYRNLTKEYIWNNRTINFTKKGTLLNKLTNPLNFISKLKNKPDSPNPKEDYINIQESIILYHWIDTTCQTNSRKNNYVFGIKSFLSYTQKMDTIKLELLSLNYINEFPRTPDKKATAIPDHELEKINSIMVKHLNDSYINQLYYAIFHLCLQTEFRISQICSLHANCIVPTLKNNQYKILTKSKTSNGQQYTAIISKMTKAHIDNIINISEKTRNECTDPKVQHYLFLYKGRQHTYRPLDSQNFRLYFKKCCALAGVQNHNPNNLRDTHMTKAEEFRMRHNESDAVLTVLSGHRQVDITHNHYIQTQLTKMLESTYGIIIGDIDINGTIISEIENSKISNREHLVEQGCGYCTKEKCEIYSGISCLMCKDFVTTLENQRDFEIAILKLDNLITSAPTQHDKDDLSNIKRLFVAYLLQILKQKQEVTANG